MVICNVKKYLCNTLVVLMNCSRLISFSPGSVEMTGSLSNGPSTTKNLLYDHRPIMLFEDDYSRVCLIPKRKVL